MADVVVSRLKSSLMQSGLQQSNQPLFDVINQLINSLNETNQNVVEAAQTIANPYPGALVIQCDASGIGIKLIANTGNNAQIQFYKADGTTLVAGLVTSVAPNLLSIGDGSGTPITIDFTNQRVGINNIIPTEALDVVGNIKAGRFLQLVHTVNPFIRLSKTNGPAQIWDINGGSDFVIVDTTGNNTTLTIVTDGSIKVTSGVNLHAAVILDSPTAAYGSFVTLRKAGITKWYAGMNVLTSLDNYEIYDSASGTVSLRIKNTTNEIELAGVLTLSGASTRKIQATDGTYRTLQYDAATHEWYVSGALAMVLHAGGDLDVPLTGGVTQDVAITDFFGATITFHFTNGVFNGAS